MGEDLENTVHWLAPKDDFGYTVPITNVEQWKYSYLYGSLVEILLFFHLYSSGTILTVLTVLTAAKVFVDVLML